MRLPNKELENQILQMAIELLMEKEPAEIGMRDVAKKMQHQRNLNLQLLQGQE